MTHSLRDKKIPNFKRARAHRATWFWRGILVAAVTHSVLATADFSVDTESVWSELSQAIDLHAVPLEEFGKKIVEFDLPDHSLNSQSSEKMATPVVSTTQTVITGVQLPRNEMVPLVVVASPSENQFETDSDEDTVEVNDEAASSSVSFPSDVPQSEIIRVSRTFHGMIQESIRENVGPFSGQYLGSLATSEPLNGERLAELETTLLDETATDDGYALGEEVEQQAEATGLDPFKTYTVVNGKIHAVTPTQIARPTVAQVPEAVVLPSSQDARQQLFQASYGNADVESQPTKQLNSSVELSLPQEEVSKGLGQILSTNRSAALDQVSAQSERVTIQGKVNVPSGYAADKVVLRLAGTAFQVQTDSSGSFELRDVPRGTRFELLVWHIDGSLTRRLVPVTASGREKQIEITLQKTADVDSLASTFGLVQQMNQGGFCARVEADATSSLVGGQVVASAGRKNLHVHFFSEAGLPVASQSELSTDGRMCVFNVDESIVDVKVTLLNGARRQFVVHVEPSTFEHDLVFDLSESMYRRVSLMEPLDTQQVIELSAQNVQPDFGDKRLRDWLQGNDVPVWTRVSRFVLQSDAAYSVVRPNAEEVQFFPGGQEFVEVRMAPDVPGASWSRVIVSRDQLMTSAMLKQLESLKSRILQDRNELMSMAALDADAWDEIVAQHVDIPRLQSQTIGGLYVSVDPAGLGISEKDLLISVRDTWTGKEVCTVQTLRPSNEIKSGRYMRAACGASPGQYALIIESREGALVWSDVVRIRAGDVQTVTVLDPKF